MFNIVKSQKSKVESQTLATANWQSNSKYFASFFIVLLSLYSISSNAQCAMCRASLESTGDVSQAEAVNDGIVYLMIIPYVLVALIAYAVYKMFRKNTA